MPIPDSSSPALWVLLPLFGLCREVHRLGSGTDSCGFGGRREELRMSAVMALRHALPKAVPEVESLGCVCLGGRDSGHIEKSSSVSAWDCAPGARYGGFPFTQYTKYSGGYTWHDRKVGKRGLAGASWNWK